jgi:hypothetical protein
MTGKKQLSTTKDALQITRTLELVCIQYFRDFELVDSG